MTVAWRIAGAVAALLATVGLVVLSDVALSVAPSERALVRLSWRSVGQRIEECRAPTEAELAALPPHMRMREICEGRLTPFQLRVRLDGALVVDRELRPAGAREDRPTYVFEELEVAPGPHELEVAFSTVGAPGETPRSAPLRFDGTVSPGPREVVLITHTEGEAQLVARSR